MQHSQQQTTALMLSGGIDSAVLLDQLMSRGWDVAPIYIRTGCAWESCELFAIRRFLAALAQARLSDLVMLDMPLEDLYGDHWSISGADPPDDTSPHEAVFLPGRNPLLLIKPSLWCWMHGIEHLALATLSGNPFEDATPEFFARFEAMFRVATGHHVQIARPFERLPKHRVLEMGRHLPLELTFSCLAPVDGLHCGRCNKCAERRRAFRELQLPDATHYAAVQPAIHPV
jgi:7-cyano-7-deazaguanine synthase